jgi:hypothetical protein
MGDTTNARDDDPTTGTGVDAGSGVEDDGRSPLGQQGAFRDAEGTSADTESSEQAGTESVPRAGGGPAPTDGTGTSGTGVTGSAAVS